MRYRALRKCWHRPYQMRFEPGEIIPLYHLTKQEIQLLISKGVVRAIPEPPKVVVKPTPKKRVGTPRKKRGAALVKTVVKKKVVPAKPKKPVVSGMSTLMKEVPVEPVNKFERRMK